MKNDEVTARLGANVRTAREARGWSQDQLAAQLTRTLGREMKPLTVLRIEKGTRPTSVLELVTLADVFGTTIGNLAGEGDEDSSVLPAITRAAFARSGYLDAAEKLVKAERELDALDLSGASERATRDFWDIHSEVQRLLDDTTARREAEFRADIAKMSRASDGPAS